jgi:hypothetical protein
MRRRAPRFNPNATENRVLTALARVQFATAEQLSHWVGTSKQAVSLALKELNVAGLIEPGADTKPVIWLLTLAGAARMRVPMPSGRRHSSWSVMQNACHRNAVEIALGREHAGFRFLPRLSLYKLGFNPSHGEYAAVQDDGTTWLVLIDDYFMESRRIEHHWNREHRPPRKYWPEIGRRWHNIANRYAVYTTNDDHRRRHEDFVRSTTIPVDVYELKPLWRFSGAF